MSNTLITIIKSISYLLLFWSASVFVLLSLKYFFPRVYKFVYRLKDTYNIVIRFKSKEVIGEESIITIVLTLLQGIRFVITLSVLYLAIILSVDAIPWTKSFDPRSILNSIITTLFILVAARFIFKAIQSLHGFVRTRLTKWKGTNIKGVSISTLELLSADRITSMLQAFNSGLRIVLAILLAYLTMTSIFGLFSFTKQWSATLLEYITTPLFNAVATIIGYLPNLFTIIVIVFITRYAIKLIHMIFTEVERGNFSIPGFYADWAEPTYKIVRFLTIVFATVIIFPYLPGSNSDAFKGISVFLGILFSFGSSSAISSIVSGIVLTYMRPFKIGDRVKISDTVGDIVERTLLVTRVRTIKNVDVTIPNAMVLASHIINYSAQAEGEGLILHSTVTIGYDAPWQKVHELLLNAAKNTEGILDEPKPFVLQTALNDFYVSYELNVYTDTPKQMSVIYSHLHEQIQDSFNKGGIEIMSPHYSALRDGNNPAVPEEHVPKERKKGGFRIFPFGSTTQE